jgi:plastocyanin
MRSIALVAGVLAAGCFSERIQGPIGPVAGECTVSLESPVIGSVGTVVALQNFDFQPAEVRIPVGARVTWLNCEGTNIDAHTTTSDTGVWESDQLRAGASFSRVFDQPGRFEYHCEPHPFMTGVVIVE